MTTELAPSPPHITGPTWQKTVDGGWHLPEKTLGWGVLNWWAEYVKSPGGETAGQAFMPTLEQARFTLWWYAVDEHGNYYTREGVLRRLKGWGKDPFAAALSLAELCGPVAFSHFDENGEPVGKRRHAPWIQIAAVAKEQPLALDTEVPTPSGWTTVGDLKVGDYVYGSDGLPHEIKRETEVFTGLDCYRVKFDDGTEVVASAGHGWTTERLNGHGDKYETVTVTTEELAETARGSKNRKRHRIPVVGFASEDRDLLVDPWFLGLWLGDGATADTQVVFDWRLKGEYETLLKPLVAEFQTIVWTQHGDNWGTFRIKNNDRKRDSESLRVKLRTIGVLGNKHIPADYMNAGTEQRRELLRGLIDSDGGVDIHGKAYFVNSNRELVWQVRDLVNGLGLRCSVVKHGPDGALRANFNAGTLFRISKLAYKYDRQKPYKATSRSQHRWVESVEKIETVPVKCIGIDTDDHLFQVTRGRILTHNTENTFSMFPVMVSEKMKRDYRMEMNKFIIYSEGGVGRIQAVTSSPASMEGKRPTFIILNEIQWWGTGPSGEINEGHAMAGVIKGNMDKILEARSLAICNAHVPGNDSLGERYYDRWQKIAGGLEVDTGLLYDSLEAPSDTPVSEIPSKMEDPDGFELGFKQLRIGLEVARGDSVWLPLDKIALSVLDSMTPITESRRKFLNQVNAAEDSWIAPHEWDRCVRDPLKGDVPLRPLERGDQISLGFDGSKSSDHTALCACRIDDGAIFLIKTWVPDNYPNNEIPRDDVDAYVRSIFEKYDVVSFRADVKEFESYVDQWGKDFKRKIKVNASPNNPVAYDMRGQQKRFSFDCERFLDAVLERQLIHDGNPVLRQHVLNAHRHPTNWEAVTIRKASRDSSRKIDAAVTAVLCFGGRQEFLMSRSNRGRGAVVLR